MDIEGARAVSNHYTNQNNFSVYDFFTGGGGGGETWHPLTPLAPRCATTDIQRNILIGMKTTETSFLKQHSTFIFSKKKKIQSKNSSERFYHFSSNK